MACLYIFRFITRFSHYIFVLAYIIHFRFAKGYDYLEGLDTGTPCFTPRRIECDCKGTLLDHFTSNASRTGKNPPDTNFLLFTLKNPTNPEFLHDCCGKLPKNTNYNRSHNTEIFIHGWLDGACRSAWMREMKDQLFMRRNGDYNVILLDWSWGNIPDYIMSASNNRIVGEQLAFVVNNIIGQMSIDGSLFHIIGHSFGSHIAGFAGKLISGLRRITALDPAAIPYKNQPSSKRLSRNDAKIVDVIHTAGAECFTCGLGYKDPIGDADFYPNGGERQVMSGQEIISRFLTLDLAYGLLNLTPYFYKHLISIQYYKASINPCGCQFVGIKCSSYRSFRRGRCKVCNGTESKCAVMGMDFELYYNNDGKNNTYYLKTDAACPYCNNDGINLNGFTTKNNETYRCANTNNLRGKSNRKYVITP